MQREDKGETIISLSQIPFGAFHQIVHWQRLHVRAVETCPLQSCLIFKRFMSRGDEETDSEPAGREQEVSRGGTKQLNSTIRSESIGLNGGAVRGKCLYVRHMQTIRLDKKSHVCKLSCASVCLCKHMTEPHSLRSET